MKPLTVEECVYWLALSGAIGSVVTGPHVTSRSNLLIHERYAVGEYRRAVRRALVQSFATYAYEARRWYVFRFLLRQTRLALARERAR